MLTPPIIKVFGIFSKNDFYDLKIFSIIVFRRYDLVEKSVARLILGLNFLNKTSNLNFALGLHGKQSKITILLFCSVLCNEFHYRTKLMAFCSAILYLKDNLVLDFTKLWVLRVPPIQMPTQNRKMKILLSEFHPRI
jgi:hypothetical protein